MKKKLFCVLCLAMALILLMTGCRTSKSFTFDIETGDQIEVTADTSSDWNLEVEDSSYYVSYVGKDTDNAASEASQPVLSGMFLTADDYYANIEIISEMDSAEPFTFCGYSGYHYTFDGQAGMEEDYIALISENTAVIVGSLADRDVAEEALGVLSFSVVSSGTGAADTFSLSD